MKRLAENFGLRCACWSLRRRPLGFAWIYPAAGEQQDFTKLLSSPPVRYPVGARLTAKRGQAAMSALVAACLEHDHSEVGGVQHLRRARERSAATAGFLVPPAVANIGKIFSSPPADRSGGRASREGAARADGGCQRGAVRLDLQFQVGGAGARRARWLSSAEVPPAAG